MPHLNDKKLHSVWKINSKFGEKSTFVYDVEDKEVTQHKANGVDMGQGMGRGWRGSSSYHPSKAQRVKNTFQYLKAPMKRWTPTPPPTVKAMTNAQNRTDISSK